MPTFYYKARNSENVDTEGLVQAASEEAAADILIDRNLTILWVKEQRGGVMGKSMEILSRVSMKDMMIFSRQLSVLISANIPLVQSLRILIKQTVRKNFKIIISEIADDVEGGAKLSSALAKHEKIFDNFYVNMVRSGETSGRLDETLEYLANQIEKDYDLISKIRGAMIYPVLVLFMLGGVGILVMTFVIPSMTAIFKEANAQLPLSTRILMAASDFFIKNWILILVSFIALIIALKFILKTHAGRVSWDMLKFKIPIFGSLFKKIAIVRFSRSLHTLIMGGISLPRSLRITAEVVGNEIYKNIIEETIKEVESGNPVATVFVNSREVPLMVSQMLNVGEKTGRLDQILSKLTDFYSREIDNLVRNSVTLIEPLVMIMMGVAVGLMVAAVIMPMYSLSSAI